MNYEVVPAPIPRNRKEVEQFELWLEKASAAGAVLVTTTPTVLANTVLCVFSVQQRGALSAIKEAALKAM